MSSPIDKKDYSDWIGWIKLLKEEIQQYLEIKKYELFHVKDRRLEKEIEKKIQQFNYMNKYYDEFLNGTRELFKKGMSFLRWKDQEFVVFDPYQQGKCKTIEAFMASRDEAFKEPVDFPNDPEFKRLFMSPPPEDWGFGAHMWGLPMLTSPVSAVPKKENPPVFFNAPPNSK